MASAAAAKKCPRPFQSRLARRRPAGGTPRGPGRWLERLARLLVGQSCGRELAQLVVDERQQLLGGVRVALLDGGQDVGDVAHGSRIPAAARNSSPQVGGVLIPRAVRTRSG